MPIIGADLVDLSAVPKDDLQAIVLLPIGPAFQGDVNPLISGGTTRNDWLVSKMNVWPDSSRRFDTYELLIGWVAVSIAVFIVLKQMGSGGFQHAIINRKKVGNSGVELFLVLVLGVTF